MFTVVFRNNHFGKVTETNRSKYKVVCLNNYKRIRCLSCRSPCYLRSVHTPLRTSDVEPIQRPRETLYLLPCSSKWDLNRSIPLREIVQNSLPIYKLIWTNEFRFFKIFYSTLLSCLLSLVIIQQN